jgi:tetratricopeptide (TPR) repeat protein
MSDFQFTDPRMLKAFRDLKQAVSCQQQGLFDEAEKIYARVIKKNPDYFDALHFYGLFKFQRCQYNDAFKIVAKAIKINPRSANAYNTFGVIQAHLSRHLEALVSFDAALKLEPNRVQALSNRCNSLNEIGRYQEAISFSDRVLAIDRNYLEVYLPRGAALLYCKRYEEALESYEQAIRLNPNLAMAWLGRGNVFYKLKRYDEAFAAYDKALSIKPDLEGAWLGRGNVFVDLKRYGEAFAAYDKALTLKADFSEAYNSRGALLYEFMQIENAIADYDKAIEIKPNDAEAYWNKSLGLLLIGKMDEGWKLFEWRWQTRSMRSSRRSFLQPLWLGIEPLAGKSVQLYSEQALGDTIQFCRYAKLVADLGAKVILEVPKPLMRLLANLSGVAQLVEEGSALPPFDFQCPLMSLPLAFKTDLANIPANIPYIKSEADKSEYWKEKLGERSKPRVGLVWSGGFRPNHPEVWRVNERRNIALAKLAALKDVDVEFYSLQKGQPAESELAELVKNNWDGPHIIDYTSELKDFSDTAALIDNLDSLISVDTSTAHLAGAMGKPVWILNRFDIDWRWLLDRSDSPWYPTARLYRQEIAGNWDDVVQRVRHDLISFFHS